LRKFNRIWKQAKKNLLRIEYQKDLELGKALWQRLKQKNTSWQW